MKNILFLSSILLTSQIALGMKQINLTILNTKDFDEIKKYNVDIGRRIEDHRNGGFYLDGEIEQIPVWYNLEYFLAPTYPKVMLDLDFDPTIFQKLINQNRPDLLQKILDYDPEVAKLKVFQEKLQHTEHLALLKEDRL